MSINSKEATRLANVCLPKILAENGEDKGEGVIISEQNVSIKNICRLWAGMGFIYQVTVTLPSSSQKNKMYKFIIKHVIPPPKRSRSFGDERKASSYLIEANFYESIAPILIDQYDLSIPTPYHVERNEGTDEVTICMSLLVSSPNHYLSDDDSVHSVLCWLATLHAATWGEKVDAYATQNIVQPIGSYWHLDTRPSEHTSMSNKGWEGRLKLAARAIDERLKRDAMQCCIHGDAKDANMLFFRINDAKKEVGRNSMGVSMYDFQYCGKAPPSVDLAYFLCVAVGDTNSEYIQYYHQQLISKLSKNDYQPTLKELESSVSLAFCDFQRFMSGWGQWGSDISSVVIQVLDRLDGGRMLKSEDDYI